MASRTAKSGRPRSSGNLRIGDHWNAITIIALSQSNPLKAVAELVENSIDARAKTIVITRGKEKGQHYLRVKDDGEGVRRNADGEPDFHYVATHVCDSVKRQLKAQGAGGLQGEFGIGLLSFWTLGEELLLTSGERGWTRLSDASLQGRPELSHHAPARAIPRAGDRGTDQRHPAGHQELQRRQDPVVSRLRSCATAFVIPASRSASSIEPRGRNSRSSRASSRVDCCTNSMACCLPQSEVYAELYLHAHSPANAVSLYRSGTRVLGDLAELDAFARMPWTSGYVQGIVDAPYLNLTPGTRLGVIQDAALARLADELGPLESRLAKIIEDQQRAEEERASRDVLRSVQGALKEALLALPAEEYDCRRGISPH